VARIYTRTGDNGTTGLLGGKRVPKNSPYIETGGSLDELSALLGVVLSHELPDEVKRILQSVQDDIFTIGAELASPVGTKRQNSGIGDEEIQKLEREIDAIEKDLEPLKQFILPGGSVPGAEMHLARAVARRAERHCVTLSQIEKVNPAILRYLNRLSDLCFVLARYINRQQSMPELHPTFGKSRESE
jgi:cob(I)alamin adenosyltransferase